MKYEHEDFIRLIDIIKSKFKFFKHTIHKNIIEFRWEGELIICRFIYFESKKQILVSFHYGTEITDCILIYDYAKKICPTLMLGETFYMNHKGEIFTGMSAQEMALKELLEDIHLDKSITKIDKEKLH